MAKVLGVGGVFFSHRTLRRFARGMRALGLRYPRARRDVPSGHHACGRIHAVVPVSGRYGHFAPSDQSS